MKTLATAALILLLAPCLRASEKIAVIATSEGKIEVTLAADAAPKNVQTFEKYVKDRVYRYSTFDSANELYVFGGSPGRLSRGYGSSGNMAWQKGAPGEFGLKHVRGAVAMGRTVGDCNPHKTSNSTKFGIYLVDAPQQDGEYTVFGHVSTGMDVVDRIAAKLRDGTQRPIQITNIQVTNRP